MGQDDGETMSDNEYLFEVTVMYEDGNMEFYFGNAIHIQPSIISKGINLQIEEPDVDSIALIPAIDLDLLDHAGSSHISDPLEI